MRFGENIYYCTQKQIPEGLQEFNAPVTITLRPHHCSVQPTSGYSALQTYGKDIVNYQTAIFQPYDTWKETFKEGDLFYLDGASPNAETEEFYGDSANFIVDKAFLQNEAVRLVLKRRN